MNAQQLDSTRVRRQGKLFLLPCTEYKWTIGNFDERLETSPKEGPIRSPEFEVNGVKWHVEISRGIPDRRNKDRVHAMFSVACEKPQKATLGFLVHILNEKGEKKATIAEKIVERPDKSAATQFSFVHRWIDLNTPTRNHDLGHMHANLIRRLYLHHPKNGAKIDGEEGEQKDQKQKQLSLLCEAIVLPRAGEIFSPEQIEAVDAVRPVKADKQQAKKEDGNKRGRSPPPPPPPHAVEVIEKDQGEIMPDEQADDPVPARIEKNYCPPPFDGGVPREIVVRVLKPTLIETRPTRGRKRKVAPPSEVNKPTGGGAVLSPPSMGAASFNKAKVNNQLQNRRPLIVPINFPSGKTQMFPAPLVSSFSPPPSDSIGESSSSSTTQRFTQIPARNSTTTKAVWPSSQTRSSIPSTIEHETSENDDDDDDDIEVLEGNEEVDQEEQETTEQVEEEEGQWEEDNFAAIPENRHRHRVPVILGPKPFQNPLPKSPSPEYLGTIPTGPYLLLPKTQTPAAAYIINPIQVVPSTNNLRCQKRKWEGMWPHRSEEQRQKFLAERQKRNQRARERRAAARSGQPRQPKPILSIEQQRQKLLEQRENEQRRAREKRRALIEQKKQSLPDFGPAQYGLSRVLQRILLWDSKVDPEKRYEFAWLKPRAGRKLPESEYYECSHCRALQPTKQPGSYGVPRVTVTNNRVMSDPENPERSPKHFCEGIDRHKSEAIQLCRELLQEFKDEECPREAVQNRLNEKIAERFPDYDEATRAKIEQNLPDFQSVRTDYLRYARKVKEPTPPFRGRVSAPDEWEELSAAVAENSEEQQEEEQDEEYENGLVSEDGEEGEEGSETGNEDGDNGDQFEDADYVPQYEQIYRQPRQSQQQRAFRGGTKQNAQIQPPEPHTSPLHQFHLQQQHPSTSSASHQGTTIITAQNALSFGYMPPPQYDHHHFNYH